MPAPFAGSGMKVGEKRERIKVPRQRRHRDGTRRRFFRLLRKQTEIGFASRTAQANDGAAHQPIEIRRPGADGHQPAAASDWHRATPVPGTQSAMLGVPPVGQVPATTIDRRDARECFRVFSSEVDTGSRRENTTNQKARARF
jgi:hypothetical protein